MEKVDGAISLTGSTYNQAFTGLGTATSGSISGGDLSNVNSNLNGWYFNEVGGNTVITAGTGSVGTGDSYNFGTSGGADRSLGGLQSGSVTPSWGFFFTNNTGNTITSIAISYLGETWRVGTASRSDRIDFQYSGNSTTLTNGTWTDSNALDYANPGQATGSGALQHSSTISSTLSGLSLTNGSSFAFRWTDLDASGADDGMGIDDFSMTFTYASVVQSYWDANGSTAGIGGAGTWSSGSALFSSTTGGTDAGTRADADPVIFEGTAGTVEVSGTVNANGGITFNTDGFTVTVGTVNLGGATNTITTASGVSAAFSTSLTGTTGLIKAGAGTLVLSSSNSLSGAVSVTAGQLTLGVDGALGSATSVSTAGTLFLNGVAGNRINNSATVTITSGGLFNLSGLDETIGALTITAGAAVASVTTGAGTLTVGGAIAATGGTGNSALISGKLDLGSAVRALTVTNGTITTDLDLNGVVISNGGLNLTGATSSRTDFGAASTFAGGFTLTSGDIALTASSSGTAGTPTSGPLGVGTVTFAGGNVTALTSARTLHNNAAFSGNFTVAGSNQLSILGGVDLNAAVRTVTTTAPLSLQGTISNGGLTKAGAGTLTLSGSNSFASALAIQAGTLSIATINDASSNGVLGNSATAVALGTTGSSIGTVQYTGSSATSTKPFSLATSGGGAFQIDTAGTNLGLLGLISGSGTLTKSGAGTLTLSGPNSFSGQLSITAGTLQTATVNNASAVGPLGNSSSAVILGSSAPTTGTLQYTGATATSSKPFAVASGGTGTFQIDDVNASLNLTGALSGSGSFIKTGSGTLRLNPTSTTYTGSLTISGGTVETTTANYFGEANSAIIINSGILRYAYTYTDTNKNNLQVTAAGGTVEVTATNTYQPGIITGGGALNKTGSGTLLLSSAANANTWSGPTVISGGTLLLAASQVIPNASAVTLDGGIIALNSASTETTGTLSLGTTGTNILKFNEAGTINFAASSGSTWAGAVLHIWNWNQGTTHLFFGSNSSGLTETQLGQITVFDGGGTTPLGSFQLNNLGELTPVPEVGAVFGALALLAPLAYRERRHWMRCREARLA